jgi:hypothetical protein
VADIARFADLFQRMPFEWRSLQAQTLIWCLHCERAFRFEHAKIDPDDGLLMCGYWPDCDGSALDYWPWSPEDWAVRMEEQGRPENWPEQPIEGTRYPLYP